MSDKSTTINGRNLFLASASPRRIAMMNEHGYDPVVCPADIEETMPKFLTPEETAMHLALSKALAAVKEHSEEAGAAPSLFVGSDTIVVFGGEIFGKPKDREDALRMLRAMSGTTHEVISGVALVCGDTERSKCFFERTEITFCELPEDELQAYVDTEEPYDKAGAYAIQETFGKYVIKTVGDIDNVIGFPWKRFAYEAYQI